jgi:hypothetical protein
LKLRANALRASALPSAGRVAVIQIPRPGRRRLRSGTTEPPGDHNRTVGHRRHSPVTAQPFLPDNPARTPVESIVEPIVEPVIVRSRLHAGCVHSLCFACARSPQRRLPRWRRCEILLLIQPALTRACLIRPRLLGEIEVGEDAGVLHGLAVLALLHPIKSSVTQPARSSTVLRPSSPSATSILVVAREPLEVVVDAKFLRLSSSSASSLSRNSRARLQLLRGFLVEAFDAGELLLVDQRTSSTDLNFQTPAAGQRLRQR